MDTPKRQRWRHSFQGRGVVKLDGDVSTWIFLTFLLDKMVEAKDGCSDCFCLIVEQHVRVKISPFKSLFGDRKSVF